MSEIKLDLTFEVEEAARRARRDHMPDRYMPAMPPFGLIRWVGHRVDAWRFRRKLLRLLDYSDHMLDDMGHTRAELMMASKLPLKENARQALLDWKAVRRRTG